MAVLRATAGLDADDSLDLDLRAAPAHPHLVRELERVRHPLVCKPEHVERLRLVETNAVLEHLRAGDGEDVVGQCSVLRSGFAGRAYSSRPGDTVATPPPGGSFGRRSEPLR